MADKPVQLNPIEPSRDGTKPPSAGWASGLLKSPARRGLLLVGLVILGTVIANTGRLESAAGTIVPRCPTNAIFGLHCPACGSTRAVMRLFHGDLAGALHHNPVVVLLLPFFAYVFVSGTDLFARSWPRWQVVVLVLVIALYTVLRNLPYWPWILLAPPV